MSKWKVGSAEKASMGMAGGVMFAGAMMGTGLSIAIQNVQHFGFFAAVTGSRLGLMGVDVGTLAKGAVFGAAAGLVLVAGAAVSLGADKLQSWRSQRSQQAGIEGPKGPKI
jgi:hypothetical protein